MRFSDVIDWRSPQLMMGLLRLTDLLAILLGGWLAALASEPPAENGGYMIVAVCMAALICQPLLSILHAYDIRETTKIWHQFWKIFWSWGATVFLLCVLAEITGTAVHFTHAWFGGWVFLVFMLIFAFRTLFTHMTELWRRRGMLKYEVAIIGAGQVGQRFINYLTTMRGHEVHIVGVYDERSERAPEQVEGHIVQNTINALIDYARIHPLDSIIIALPWQAENRIMNIMERVSVLPVDVHLCPDMIGFRLAERKSSYLGGISMMNMAERPFTGWDWLLKEAEDRILSALILAVIWPVMLAIAIAVKLDSPGPVFFRQERHGFNNGVFYALKFRTMRHDPDSEFKQATKNDDRVTRLGRFLRCTSLDELPQLINVLKGDMSLVGPRPHPVALNNTYSTLINGYLARHKVKPGITGLAQISGFRGETDTIDKMENRIRCDLEYVENWSLALDLWIIVRTIFLGFVHKNAY